MKMQTPYESYKHALEMADPSMQIIMLYDAAINNVKQAKDAVKQQDHDTRYQLIEKSMIIIRGLRACLDFSANEEVALAMNQYYESIDNLMISAQCDPSEKICDAIIQNLQIIKDTWSEIHLHANAVPENDNRISDSEDILT